MSGGKGYIFKVCLYLPRNIVVYLKLLKKQSLFIKMVGDQARYSMVIKSREGMFDEPHQKGLNDSLGWVATSCLWAPDFPLGP